MSEQSVSEQSMSPQNMNPLPYLEARLIADADFAADQDAATGAAPGDAVRLAASRCTACGRVDFPRRLDCPACASPVQDIALAHDAVLAGSTSVLHPPPGAMVETPYHIGVAAFPEGISILGQLLVDALDQIQLGDPIEVVATEVDGTATYAFRSASG